jgi:hypothetical protein
VNRYTYNTSFFFTRDREITPLQIWHHRRTGDQLRPRFIEDNKWVCVKIGSGSQIDLTYKLSPEDIYRSFRWFRDRNI